MGNIFDTAPVAATVKVSKTKAEKRAVHAVEGLSELAAIDALIASLQAARLGFEGQVKDQGQEIYVSEALKTGLKPETFNLVDDMSTGQYQVRKRSTASPLTDDEIALCEAMGLPTVKNTKVEKRFVFNPEAIKDQAVMEKVSKALTRIPELKDMNIVQLQEAVETVVVADGAIEKACTLKVKSQMVAALALVSVPAIRTAFDSEEAKDALDVLSKAGLKLVPDAEPKTKRGKKA